MSYNNILSILQLFKPYISGNNYMCKDKKEKNIKLTSIHDNNHIDLSPKLKINDNIKKYLNEYNTNHLKNYVNSKNNKIIISPKLPPLEPNSPVNFYSLTHILSFLAGYYLSNFLK